MILISKIYIISFFIKPSTLSLNNYMGKH